MATWIAHMRIAAHFMKKHQALNNTEFLVGNIGPDCGVPNDDWSAFTPDKNVTHWHNGGEDVDAADFKDRYLSELSPNPFYIGYYLHLLTDIEWTKFYKRKRQYPSYAEGLQKDPQFIWKIKDDWYGQDHLFLLRNPDCIFYTLFAKIREFDNVYFDFFPKNAFIRQVQYITNFYLTETDNPDREFPYLSREEMDAFVQDTIAVLEEAWPRNNQWI